MPQAAILQRLPPRVPSISVFPAIALPLALAARMEWGSRLYIQETKLNDRSKWLHQRRPVGGALHRRLKDCRLLSAEADQSLTSQVCQNTTFQSDSEPVRALRT
jgi:hypothetical protein